MNDHSNRSGGRAGSMRRALVFLVTSYFAFACGGGPAPAVAQEAPDWILHSGSVWTAAADQSGVEAIAVGNGRVMALGSTEEMLALRGPDTRVRDLDGQFVMPGFIDTHVHLASAGRFLEFNLMATTDQEEFVERVRELTARLDDGEWILGGYWGAYDAWAPGRADAVQREPFVPRMELIEALTTDHPVFLRKFDGSRYAANAAALRAAGLNPERPVAEGIEFERGDDGRPTGLFHGPNAARLFRSVAPTTFSYERRLDQTRYALDQCARHGVTTISDMSDDTQLAIYRDLRARGQLPIRIDFRYTLDRWEELAGQGLRVGSGDSWIRLGSLKGFIDGIMGTNSARFFDPYDHDPDNRGRWRTMMLDEHGEPAPEKFLGYLLGADKAGMQITVHAIGDEANHVLLDFLEELERVNGRRDRRFRVVHAQVVSPEDFERFGRLGVVAEVQPYHLSDDMRWMEERIGYERCRTAYAFRSLADQGTMLCFGSDWPGTSAAEYPINPLLAVYAATERKTYLGEPAGGWFPEQRLGRIAALRAHTWNAAYALFEEDSRGSLAPGKLADLVVFDRDLREVPAGELLEARVMLTMVEGNVVFDR